MQRYIYTYIYITDTINCYNHLRYATTERHKNNGKGWYFWFEDDNRMSYKYILSINWTCTGPLNTCSPICCKDKEGNRENCIHLRHNPDRIYLTSIYACQDMFSNGYRLFRTSLIKLYSVWKRNQNPNKLWYDPQPTPTRYGSDVWGLSRKSMAKTEVILHAFLVM